MTRSDIAAGLPLFVALGRDVDPAYVLLLGREVTGAIFPRTLYAEAGGRFGKLRGLTFQRGGFTFLYTWHPASVTKYPKRRDEFLTDVAMFAAAVSTTTKPARVRIPLHI